MKRHLYLPLLLCVVALARPARADAGAAPRVLPAEAAKVATAFVQAFVKNDRDAISAMLPAKPAERYGPSPFKAIPALSKPRADGRTAAINFEGGRAEGSLPEKGIMVLRKMEENGHTVWRVRQIYWYDKLPSEARQVPDKSKTPDDRAQEPAIRKAAMDFVHFWIAKDYAQVDKRVFHWWDVDRKEPGWVKLTGVSLRPPASSLGGLKVGFTAHLRFLRTIPKSVDGNLWLVQENGVWRVRPLTVAFWF